MVVLESKIHAGLETTQVRRYLQRLADHAGPLRGLIVLAPKMMRLTDQDRRYADTHGITLCAARWQTLAECLDDPATATLSGDFAELLMSEDLAAPPGMGADDWQVFHAAPRAFARLERLIREASKRLIASGVMTSATPARASGERRVTATLTDGTREIRIGARRAMAPGVLARRLWRGSAFLTHRSQRTTAGAGPNGVQGSSEPRRTDVGSYGSSPQRRCSMAARSRSRPKPSYGSL